MERCFFSQPIFRGRSSGLGEAGRAPTGSPLITLLERAAKKREGTGWRGCTGTKLPADPRPQGLFKLQQQEQLSALLPVLSKLARVFKGSGCSICQYVLPSSCVGVIVLQVRRKSLAFFFLMGVRVCFFIPTPNSLQQR